MAPPSSSPLPKEVLVVCILGAKFSFYLMGHFTGFDALLALTVCATCFGSPVTSIVDAFALQSLADKADFGKQRMWGAVGWGLFSFISGSFIDASGLKSVFLLQLLLAGLTAAVAWWLDLRPSKGVEIAPKQLSWSAAILLLKDSKVAIFFAVVVLMGLGMGTISGYILSCELGASNTLMGLTLTMTCVAELPIMYFSGAIIRRMGVVNVLLMVLVCYVIRLAGYSVLRDPWMVLPIELLHGVTFGCGFSAASVHAGEIAPPGLAVTVQGLFHAAWFGLGAGLGHLGGGLLYDHYGGAYLFRSTALLVLLGLFLLAVAEPLLHAGKAGRQMIKLPAIQEETEEDMEGEGGASTLLELHTQEAQPELLVKTEDSNWQEKRALLWPQSPGQRLVNHQLTAAAELPM
eukprot:SM000069S20724  [mRNA]  locus=s69:571648:574646:+ [translate_table: standard]